MEIPPGLVVFMALRVAFEAAPPPRAAHHAPAPLAPAPAAGCGGVVPSLSWPYPMASASKTNFHTLKMNSNRLENELSNINEYTNMKNK